MTIADVADQYFTYESRVKSFQTSHPLSKRRASNASSKTAKSVKWPHQFLSAEELAKAGFFYHPTQANQDNVCCFLCHKSLDGWEEDDDPLAEHSKHSVACGWAIVAEIERQDGYFSEEYPSNTAMIDARKATFADKWPHENKKGWKCKVKQMVDAGWKYTPTPEYDDTATCTYCSLALDGWEPADKPMDEHHKRSPDCPFFTLENEHKQDSARKTKSKKDRSSKPSRISTQSSFTAASEAPSLGDLPVDDDDSVLTVATNTTENLAEKKMDKKKRTTTGKGRKTKAKKSEAVEVLLPAEAEAKENDVEIKELPSPKANRGRKRKSEQMQDSTADNVEVEAPATKRRTTRTRASAVVEDVGSIATTLPSETQTSTSEPSGSTKRGRARSVAKTGRKPSTRVASKKLQEPPLPTDEELDAALQADLDNHVSEDEKIPAVIPSKKATRSSKLVKADHAMFDTEPMEIDEVAIEAELEAMEVESKPLSKPKTARGRPRKASAKQQVAVKKAAEVEAEAREAVDELASDQLAPEVEVSILQQSPPALKPKKQRAASRKVSKQASTRAASVSALSVHDSSVIQSDVQTDDLQSIMIEQNNQNDHNEDFGNDTNLSMASQSTVVRTSASTHRDSTPKKKKGRPSKQQAANRNTEEPVQTCFTGSPSDDIDRAVDPPARTKEASPDGISMMEDRFYTPAPEFHQDDEERVPEIMTPQPARPVDRLSKAARGAMATISTPPQRDEKRSPSPQSSDVENHPPSSKPSTAKKLVTPRSATRVPLAATTPVRSPSKLNVISCLQSTNPWTAVDLDTILLRTPSDENAMAKGFFDDAVAKVKNSELTSPEKRMSVEEWILHNAQIAEEKLRNDCERMVGIFESQGTRAMVALEGVECTE